MDYKKLFRSRSLRVKILRMLSFVPDKPMLKLQYRINFGRRLDLKNPIRFTEKLHWYKLYYKNPNFSVCVDKYEVRQYLRDCGFADILTKDFGVYEDPSQIDIQSLP